MKRVELERKFYQDKWNSKKVWEVVKMARSYYLRQYIAGEQFGRGIKTSKKFISSIGILDFQEISMPERENTCICI